MPKVYPYKEAEDFELKVPVVLFAGTIGTIASILFLVPPDDTPDAEGIAELKQDIQSLEAARLKAGTDTVVTQRDYNIRNSYDYLTGKVTQIDTLSVEESSTTFSHQISEKNSEISYLSKDYTANLLSAGIVFVAGAALTYHSVKSSKIAAFLGNIGLVRDKKVRQALVKNVVWQKEEKRNNAYCKKHGINPGD